MELTTAVVLVQQHTQQLDPTGDWSARAAARHVRTAMDREDVEAGAIEGAVLTEAYLAVLDAHAADIDAAIAANERPSRVFGKSQSVQHDGKISLVGTMHKTTLELDVFTEQGATFKSTTINRYGFKDEEVRWFAVRPDYVHPMYMRTRKEARAAIGA